MERLQVERSEPVSEGAGETFRKKSVREKEGKRGRISGKLVGRGRGGKRLLFGN